jgi:hypothetical protein
LGKVSPWVKNNRRPLGGAPLKLEEIMKKLMTALAACLVAGFVVAQSVTSANIVGYQKITPTGTYPSHGPAFITVGDTGLQWKLGNMTADGMDPLSDTIQFLSPFDASVSATYTYVSASIDPGLVGWWDPTDIGGVSMDGETFAAGTGFLCNLSGAPFDFVYAGEVVQDTISLDLIGLTYPMIANPVPVDLTLGEITAEGMDPLSDTIQVLNPVDASVSATYTYVSPSIDPVLAGWWDPTDIGGVSKDSVVFQAGSAVLGNFSGVPVTMVFPNPM